MQINLKVFYQNGDEKIIEKPADCRKENKKSILIDVPKGNIKSLELDTKSTPDAYPTNNIISF